MSFIVLGVIELVSVLFGAFSGPGAAEEPSWKEQAEPNAVLMLVSVRDVRTSPARLLGERIQSDAVSLYLIGAKVRVDNSAGETVVRSRSNSVIATLRPTADDDSRFVVDGPGLDGPTYALLR